jgi:hypothetical protein
VLGSLLVKNGNADRCFLLLNSVKVVVVVDLRNHSNQDFTGFVSDARIAILKE